MGRAAHSSHPRLVSVGADVGGARKGFHAVALRGGTYADRVVMQDAKELAEWCRTAGAQAIAVDAPCGWSKDGRARPAERELMDKRIWCFSTPTKEMALNHPKKYFDWMLRGEKLYKELKRDFPLCQQLPRLHEKCCFETFPHAITWQLQGGKADASSKRKQRRDLLQAAGIDLAELTNIDFVDAALCALVAYRAATGEKCVSFGEPNTGLIIVPADPKP
jgi:predicted nuclease with RNAse H fold